MAGALHPNLARLAASYDEILERYNRGSISPGAARAEILALVARDDEGILWSIDPDTGSWMRRTRSGELVAGEPPSHGLATPTPHDLSSNVDAFSPASRIEMRKVSTEQVYGAGALAGSTRTAQPALGAGYYRHSSRRRRLGLWIAVALLALAGAVGGYELTSGSSSTTPTTVVVHP